MERPASDGVGPDRLNQLDLAYSGDSSFTRYLRAAQPIRTSGAAATVPDRIAAHGPVPHGTTVLAIRHADGVLIAGDRRATMGNLIAQHDLEKVYPTDEFSAIAFAGTVGTALELVRLFQVELEHYEKLEGVSLTVEGKVNKLAGMVRGNLGQAQQGLAVVPLFAAFDQVSGTGRLFSTDVAGSIRENRHYDAIGSGSLPAKSALKKLYQPGLAEATAGQLCVQALADAAEEDSATGGPDQIRRIYPVLASITAAGYRRLADDEVAAFARAIRV